MSIEKIIEFKWTRSSILFSIGQENSPNLSGRGVAFEARPQDGHSGQETGQPLSNGKWMYSPVPRGSMRERHVSPTKSWLCGGCELCEPDQRFTNLGTLKGTHLYYKGDAAEVSPQQLSWSAECVRVQGPLAHSDHRVPTLLSLNNGLRSFHHWNH